MVLEVWRGTPPRTRCWRTSQPLDADDSVLIGCLPSPTQGNRFLSGSRAFLSSYGVNDVTRILSAIEQGDPSAAEQLLPLVYDELRQIGRGTGWPRRSRPNASGDRPGSRGLSPAGRPGPGSALGPSRPLLRRSGRGHAPDPGRACPPQAESQTRRRSFRTRTRTWMTWPGRILGTRWKCWPFTRRWIGSRRKRRERPNWSSCGTSLGARWPKRPRCWASPRRRPKRTGPTPRHGCAGSGSGASKKGAGVKKVTGGFGSVLAWES